MGVTTRPGLIEDAELPLPAAAMEVMPLSVTTPVAPAIEPAPVVASAVPTEIVPVASAEGKVDLPDPKVAVTVPVALTEAQISAQKLREDILAQVFAWYGKRPVLVSDWVEPTKAERNVRIAALMAERETDPTDFLAIGQIAQEIASQIDATRPNEDIAAQAKRDRDWALACLDMIKGLVDPIKVMGGIQSTTRIATAAPAATPGKRNRPERNQKLIAWAKAKGLGDTLVLIDKTKGGYKGVYHAITPLADGTFERIDFNEADLTWKRTGVIVKSMKFFEMDGNEDMLRFFKILMKSNGIFLKIPHLNGNEQGQYTIKGSLDTLLKELA